MSSPSAPTDPPDRPPDRPLDLDAELARLRPSWASYWPGAPLDGPASGVRRRFAAAVGAWGLTGLELLSGGVVAVVAAATTRAGAPAVLKVVPRGTPGDAEFAGEGPALEFWTPTGAVPRLLGSRDAGATLLMERLDPGVPLDGVPLGASGVGAAERVDVLGGLVARLHAAGRPPAAPVSAAAYTSFWRPRLDATERAELDALVAPSPRDVLTHADLHGGNALSHAGGWRAVDPHAVLGDPALDAWALLDPGSPPVPPDPAAARREVRDLLERYCAAAGLDPGRVARWTRLRALQEAREIEAEPVLRAGDEDWALRATRLAAALSP